MKTAPEQVEEHHESHHHHAAPDGSSRRDRTVIFTTVIGVIAFVVFGIPYVKHALYSDTDPHDHGVNNSDVPVRDLDRGRRISENDVAPDRGRSENNPPIDRRDSASDAARDRGRPINDVDRERHHPETDARPERDHADSDHAKIGRADSDRVSDRRDSERDSVRDREDSERNVARDRRDPDRDDVSDRRDSARKVPVHRTDSDRQAANDHGDSDRDPDREAVRRWLNANAGDSNPREVRWWPTRELAELHRRQIAAAKQSVGNDDDPGANDYLEQLERNGPDRVCRLQYRTRSAAEIQDDLFVIRNGRVRRITKGSRLESASREYFPDKVARRTGNVE